jgi:hypothetical protein
MSPHCSAIFLQHSRSADVIAAPGNTQAATGSAASISARAETPSLINSFNITSLSTTDSKTQQAEKGFSLLPSRDRPDRGLNQTPVRKPSFSLEFLIRMFAWTPASGDDGRVEHTVTGRPDDSVCALPTPSFYVTLQPRFEIPHQRSQFVASCQ